MQVPRGGGRGCVDVSVGVHPYHHELVALEGEVGGEGEGSLAHVRHSLDAPDAQAVVSAQGQDGGEATAALDVSGGL